MSVKSILTTSLFLLAALPSQAEILWQDFSVTALKGNDYRVDFPKQTVYTFEHVAGTSWGDSFLFADHLRGSNGDRSNYAEWSPRLSFGKLSSSELSYGPIKDLLLASTIEMSEFQTNYLYGIGLDLAVPGFSFTQLNLYRRQNEDLDDSWQATLVWGLPFTLFGQQWLYDGFLDWASASKDQSAQMNLTSQLKWSLSPVFDLKSPLYLGIEYVYWLNKYGIKSSSNFRTDESNLNLLLKWHF